LKVSGLSRSAVGDALQSGSLCIDIHPFTFRLRSDIPLLADEIARIYGDFPLADATGFTDFHVEVSYARGVRRWLRPLARFFLDGLPSFVPLPAHQALAMLEWGINWCVAAHSHQYLVIHAAVVERGGRALILPAPPGSGKSTLCAALINRGWRLLSDELALYDIGSRRVYGMARPVNLKNQSIAIVHAHTPQAVISAPVADTSKGTVALMKPPAASVLRSREPALPAWIVLPRYQEGSEPLLDPHEKARTFMLLAEQCFNYDIHGRAGFDAIGDLVETCDCYQFTYSRLDDAERIFAGLAAAGRDG
jgi:HprK-related kinase A